MYKQSHAIYIRQIVAYIEILGLTVRYCSIFSKRVILRKIVIIITLKSHVVTRITLVTRIIPVTLIALFGTSW